MGIYMTGADMDARIANPTPAMEITVNGRKPIKRLKDLRGRHRQMKRAEQVAGYDRLLAQSKARRDDADEVLGLLNERITEWESALASGIDPEQILGDVKEGIAVVNAVSEDYRTVLGDQTRAEEHV